MLKKRDCAFQRLPHCVGATKAAHPSPARIEKVLKCLMPFPVRNKQIKRQDEPLITTVLRRFQIVFGYRFVHVQEHV